MNDSILHVPQLAAAISCARKARLNAEQVLPQQLYADSRLFHQTVDKILYEGVESGIPWDTNERSLQILQSGKGRNLRFELDGIRTSIPYLEQREDGRWKAVYPFASKAVKEHSLIPLLLNRYIAAQAGVDIAEHELLILNSDYVREEILEEKALLLTKRVRKERGGYFAKSIDELLDDLQQRIPPQQVLAYGRRLFSSEMPVARRVKACTSPSKCPWYTQCWKEDELPDWSPMFLASASPQAREHQQEVDDLADLDASGMDGSSLQYAQIQAARNRRNGGAGIWMDAPALHFWLEGISYPITYLDFEWETFALPPYPGMKAFDVLCFQYSAHIEQEDGSLSHASFFETGDCRKAFLESLLENIPETGSILVFNMEGAEKLRLQQLASQFPEYAQALEAIWSRMVDLSVPFEQGDYYDLAQRGRCSLKVLLPLFSKGEGYGALDIHNGQEAVFAYRQAEAACAAEKARIGEAISNYCGMDTLAEFELFHGLKQKLEERCQV